MTSRPPDDDDIWSRFTAEIKPLKTTPVHVPARKKPPPRSAIRHHMPDMPAASPFHTVRFVAGLDRTLAAQIKKGARTIEGTLDLHGQTQDQALAALKSYMSHAYFAGKRLVIVVTGKGTQPGGVLKQRMPEWLRDDFFKPLLLSVSQAAAQHGGEGALYVVLRRARDAQD